MCVCNHVVLNILEQEKLGKEMMFQIHDKCVFHECLFLAVKAHVTLDSARANKYEISIPGFVFGFLCLQ